jgi:pimeloyl-ACP methyl ester carboxylesterase
VTFPAVRSSFAIGLLAWMACAQSAERNTDVIADRVYLAPQRLVSIGDRKLNLYCAGEGSLLRAAGVDPPYVPVGHSLGGLTIKLFAFTYPREVAGLVFVDPSHEDLAKRAWEIDPRNAKKYAALLETLHACQRAKPSDFTPGSRIAVECATVSNETRSAPCATPGITSSSTSRAK